jgi:capsular polysaccharide transport system permease protein
LLEKLKSAVPALFPGKASDELPPQVQFLLQMRANRLRNFLLRILIFVILPTFLVWFYTMAIVTHRYVCKFEETYQVYQPAAALSSGLVPSSVGTSVTDSVDYGTVIYEFVKSQALAMELDKQLNLRSYFEDPKIDWTSRLAKDATDAQYYAYYGNRVSVAEGFGGYITVGVQGFDPAFTLKLAQTVNADADAMLDGITGQARDAEVKTATQQLELATAALQTANDDLTAFRNSHGDLDPSFVATQLGTIEGTLESQLATVKAQLAQAQANMQPQAPQIVQLNLQIKALENQIDAERQRLAGDTGQNYSDTVAQYQTLLSKQQLATSTYQSAQQGLVIARADAASKQNYVVDFVAPTLPDRPTMPDPLASTVTAFLGCLLVYGIFNLLFTAFRDQTGF